MESASVVLVVLITLLGTGRSDPPRRPSLPQSFIAQGEVEYHLPEELRFGTFEVGVEYGNRSYQIEVYDEAGIKETNSIYQFQNVTCFVKNNKCRNDTWKFPIKPNFWDWIANATYEGQIEIRHIKYDFWGYNVGGLRLEVAVVTGSNDTVYFNRKTAEESINYSIKSMTTKFDPKKFPGIPKICE